MSFFVFLDVLGRIQLKLGGWMELGPTKIYEDIFWQVLMVGVPGRVSFFGEGCVVMKAVTWMSFYVFQKLK